jgi:hypothetical protein
MRGIEDSGRILDDLWILAVWSSDVVSFSGYLGTMAWRTGV